MRADGDSAVLDFTRRFDRLEAHEPNQIEAADKRSKADILVAQFRAFLTYVLVAAAVISGVLGDWIEAGAIIAIVIVTIVCVQRAPPWARW